jgi:hypothetical protein
MAFYAIPVHHYFMAAPGVSGYDTLVALVADLIRIFIQ